MRKYPVGTIIHMVFETNKNTKHDRVIYLDRLHTGREIFDSMLKTRKEIEDKVNPEKAICSFSAIH